jgi:hypothetical protein
MRSEVCSLNVVYTNKFDNKPYSSRCERCVRCVKFAGISLVI